MAGFVVTVRVGPRVERRRFDHLDPALDSLEERGRELERDASARAVDLRVMRRFEPVQQVVARIEVSGPGGLRAGIDVRGDGSAEGYTGRIRRRLLEQREGESAYDALRRAVDSRGSAH
jgi:hypothetical protein